MTFLCDEPDQFAASALKGFSSLYANKVQAVRGGVIRATASPQWKVALVVGGGSGHYPAFLGMVGPGLADAAVAGDVFASPSAHSIAHVARLADHGGGILLSFGNYAGDVMNFGLAAERLSSEGFDVRVLPICDDVASAPLKERHKRRGTAGDLMVFKISGAAAEAGLSLDKVYAVAQKGNLRTVSFGVVFTGCTLPGAVDPLFCVPKSLMGVGLGAHGEPGISEEPVGTASQIAHLLVDRLLEEKPEGSGKNVAVILNGLGSTKYEELFVLWTHIEAALHKAGLCPVLPEVGEFVTSLNMAGCSLTLCYLDEDLEKYWTAASDAPILRRGNTPPSAPRIPRNEAARSAPLIPKASQASQEDAQCVTRALARMAEALRLAEGELGAIDARTGDGDHGQGMTRGSEAASLSAQEISQLGAGLKSTLAYAGDAWADKAGGTSGALWGLALRTWSYALSDEDALSPDKVAEGAQKALAAVKRLGGAHVGDKTLVDAFEPFVSCLSHEISQGASLKDAWQKAAKAATAAAEATAHLAPRLGRARSHVARSMGHPDAGAVSFALCARTIAEAL